MANILREEYLLLAVLGLYSLVLRDCFAQEACSTNMLNAVVYRGLSISFPNLYPNDNVQWQVAPSNQAFLPPNDITEYDNTVHPPYAGIYHVDKTRLSIIHATTTAQGSSDSTAGIYLANYQNTGCTAAAGLTVVDFLPTCGSDTSNPNSPQLTCSITFANYVQQGIAPIMTWKDKNGNIVKTDEPGRDSLDIDNLGYQQSTSTFPVPIGDSSSYTCVVTFSTPVPNLPPFVATNAPHFSATCSASNK